MANESSTPVLERLADGAADFLQAFAQEHGLDLEPIGGRPALTVLALATLGYLCTTAEQKGVGDQMVAVLAQVAG